MSRETAKRLEDMRIAADLIQQFTAGKTLVVWNVVEIHLPKLLTEAASLLSSESD